jgi:uncharacterized protein
MNSSKPRIGENEREIDVLIARIFKTHPRVERNKTIAPGHVTWFLGVVEEFRVFDVRVHACADPTAAVAEVRAEGLIKPTGRVYRQEYVVFLRARAGKITFLREYFDPVRAAKALDAPIVDLQE